ncbi:unnamed protein product, partial [Choristocarpus tenellus]
QAREEAIEKGEDPDVAEAALLNQLAGEGQEQQQQVEAQPEPVPVPEPAQPQMDQGGFGTGGPGFDQMGICIYLPPPLPPPPPHPSYGWSNMGEVDMAFGMWMDAIDNNGGGDSYSEGDVSKSGSEKRRSARKNVARELLETEDTYVKMLEALLSTVIRPCLGQGANKSTPLGKQEANELFGTLRAEEILAINTAFREQLKVRF